MNARKEAAEDFLRMADESGDWTAFDAYERATTYIAYAQAQATLHLAEQQRIANLIAYASHRNDHMNALGGHDYGQALRGLLGQADFAIREGLAL